MFLKIPTATDNYTFTLFRGVLYNLMKRETSLSKPAEFNNLSLSEKSPAHPFRLEHMILSARSASRIHGSQAKIITTVVREK